MRQQSSKFPVLGLLFAMPGLAFISTVFAEGSHKDGHGDSHSDGHGKGAHWISPEGEAEKAKPIKASAITTAMSTIMTSTHTRG